MLSVRSPIQKTNIVGFHLDEVPRIGKFIETESRIVVTRGSGEGGYYSLNCKEFLFGMMEKFWKWRVVMVAQYYNCNSCNRKAHIKTFKKHILCNVYFITMKKYNKKSTSPFTR